MAKPVPPQGFMGLPIDDLIGSVTKLLPPVVTDAIQDTVGKILDPHDDSINIGDPQPPERPIPVDAGSKELNGAVKAIDAALAAIGALQKLKFLIPDQYEPILDGLAGALRTVRGWLD